MDNLMIPKDYKSALNLHDTQIGIKTVKDFFQVLLAEELHLLRVSRKDLRIRSFFRWIWALWWLEPNTGGNLRSV